MTLTIINNGNKWTGVIEGRLDATNSAQFEQDMQPLIEHAGCELELDCTNMEYISSAGLRLFLTLRKAVMDQGGSLAISHLGQEPRNVFTITGFFNLFKII